MNYTIREIKKQEYDCLNDFLYKAIFIPKGVEAPDRSIINEPELQVYVSKFGDEKDDAMEVLFGKLDEAIDDMENGRVQTIEEAWKEIDSI